MNVNFSCPINNTGYGIASWNILKNLYNLNLEIAYFPIGQPSASSKEDYDLIIKLYKNSQGFDLHAPFVKIWHQFDLANHIGRGTYFALPFFELDTFNTIELSHLKVPDRLFVTSNWAKEIIRSNGIDSQVDIVPLGVDRNIFDENKYVKNHNNKYVFLNIGKWEVRKGHDILLELFQKAFPEENDVELWILASENTNNYSSAQELDQWKNMYKSDPRVKLLKSAQNHSEIAQIMNDADCGLFPSRAEGWNLELLEMMSMNKPVIATNYSAHTEFCDNNNCYLIDIKEKEKAYDGKAFIGQGYWAKIDKDQKDQIVEHMRSCFNNNIKTNSQGVLTSQKYTWLNSAETLLRCIDNP
jgi:glycosyltransferase involved in cell wall biosynthesis